MIRNESSLIRHKAENHIEKPPFICRECLLETHTWVDYVKHMKRHLRYATKCNECVYNLENKPGNVIFLCHVCNMTFDSDENLKLHVQAHLENGQSSDI